LTDGILRHCSSEELQVTNTDYADLRYSRPAVGKSPLQVVSAAFERLVCEPAPAGPPPALEVAMRSWGEVREQLRASLPREANDTIWSWLIASARQSWGQQGGQVALACTGLALPMLAGIVGRYAAAGSVDRDDAEAEIVAGFLHQIQQIDLDAPHLWSRLWSAMAHAGRAWAREQQLAPPAFELADDRGGGHPPMVQTPAGHPELVLADAVAEGVITAGAAELIVLTRLESRSVTSLAEERNRTRSHWTARKQRQRAERALAAWLAARALDPGPTSIVEARIVNEPARVDTRRSAERRTDKHPPRGSATSPASGPSTPSPTPVSDRQEARRCA
jgi:hypothetical protein